MVTSFANRAGGSLRVGLWVGPSFDGPGRDILDDRIEPSVVGCESPVPRESVSVVVVFTDEPAVIDRLGERPTVVATREPPVATQGARTERVARVLRWDADEPPWEFLQATVMAVASEASSIDLSTDAKDGDTAESEADDVEPAEADEFESAEGAEVDDSGSTEPAEADEAKPTTTSAERIEPADGRDSDRRTEPEPADERDSEGQTDDGGVELAREEDATAAADGPEPTIATYDQLMETVGDAVYALDTDGRFTYVNEAMADLTGYEPDEILGQPPGIIKDDQTVEEAERALAGMLSSTGPDDASVELDVIRKDGTRVPCEDHMTLLTEDGEFQGTVGTLRDLTTQKRREEMFAGLLDTTQEMMAAEDPRLIAGIVSRAVEETLDRELTTVRLREGDELVPIASSSAAREVLPPRPTYGIEEGPVGEAYTTGETIVRTPSEVDDDRDRGETEAALYLPLGEYGTITIATREEPTTGAHFDEQDRYFAELLAATTERALGRAEREESLRRYEKLVESVDDMAFAADETGRFTLVTPSFAAAVGCDREELIGEPITTVGDGLFDQLQGHLTGSEADESAVTEGELLVGLSSADTGDAGAAVDDHEALPVRARGVTVSTDTLDGFVVALDDISDLVSARREASRSRDRFGGLFDALTDPVVELEVTPETPEAGEASGELLRTNEAFDDLVCDATDECGMFDGRELPLPVYDRLAAAARRARASVGDGTEAGEVSSGGQTEISLTVGGRKRYFVVRDVTFAVDDHPHSILVFTEVTDLRQREQHTAVLTRILRHNLRNKLTVLQGYAGRLQQSIESPRLLDDAERLQRAATKLASLSDTAGVVQRVLRRETDTIDHDPELLVEDAVEEVRQRHPDGRVEARIETDGPVRGTRQLGHVLVELLDNGIEHAPGEEPLVEVTVHERGDRVEFVVSDEGPPIPDDEWEIVTGGREITQLRHGSGLGLWLVRWVVEDNGGELSLRENGDDGTTVAVSLPTTAVESEPVAEEE